MASAHNPVKPIANKERRARVLQNAGIQSSAQYGYKRDHEPDGERVAERDRRQSSEDGFAAALLQTQAYGEEPAHPWIDPMESSQSNEHKPRPEIRHLMCPERALC